MRSSRKPYIGWEGPRLFFDTPSRHLKESNARESSYEKPYNVANYNLMHQEPNIPAVPEDSGGILGGLTCSFVDGYCNYGIRCFAGGDIVVSGGPEEDKAGYLDPVDSLGAIAFWKISGVGNRRIDITLDESKSIHSVTVSFKDGWGKIHTENVGITCTTTPVFSWPDTFTLTIGQDWAAVPTEVPWVPTDVYNLQRCGADYWYQNGDTWWTTRTYTQDGTDVPAAGTNEIRVKIYTGWYPPRGGGAVRPQNQFTLEGRVDPGGGYIFDTLYYAFRVTGASVIYTLGDIWTGNNVDTQTVGTVDLTDLPPNNFNDGVLSNLAAL